MAENKQKIIADIYYDRSDLEAKQQLQKMLEPKTRRLQ